MAEILSTRIHTLFYKTVGTGLNDKEGYSSQHLWTTIFLQKIIYVKNIFAVIRFALNNAYYFASIFQYQMDLSCFFQIVFLYFYSYWHISAPNWEQVIDNID